MDLHLKLKTIATYDAPDHLPIGADWGLTFRDIRSIFDSFGAWSNINSAPSLGPYLVTERSWKNADVGMCDTNGDWYSPIDGSEFYPQPSHYQVFPAPPAEAR